jgi:hypothetical protein
MTNAAVVDPGTEATRIENVGGNGYPVLNRREEIILDGVAMLDDIMNLERRARWPHLRCKVRP